MRGARVIRKFRRGVNRCTIYRKGKITKTICWSSKAVAVKRFVNRGRKCALMRSPGRQWVKCIKSWKFGSKGRFLYRGAKIVRRYLRQGQQCSVYRRGANLFHRCSWSGNMKGARIIRRFNRGRGLRCIVYRRGRQTKTVCWSKQTKIVKKVRRGSRTCITYRRGARTWMRCRTIRRRRRGGRRTSWSFMRWGRRFNFRGARQTRRFNRQGQQCIEF